MLAKECSQNYSIRYIKGNTTKCIKVRYRRKSKETLKKNMTKKINKT